MHLDTQITQLKLCNLNKNMLEHQKVEENYGIEIRNVIELTNNAADRGDEIADTEMSKCYEASDDIILQGPTLTETITYLWGFQRYPSNCNVVLK